MIKAKRRDPLVYIIEVENDTIDKLRFKKFFITNNLLFNLAYLIVTFSIDLNRVFTILLFMILSSFISKYLKMLRIKFKLTFNTFDLFSV